MKEFYKDIFRRKSVRKYSPMEKLAPEVLDGVRQHFLGLKSLDENIRTAFRIVKVSDTNASFGEYCLLLYSEKKDAYLLNAGFLLEQMDLYMQARNIGVCWLGLAKPKELKYDDLDFVIMLTFGYSSPENFRTSVAQFNRKKVLELLDGNDFADILAPAFLAPSACNSQPWRVKTTENSISVFRKTNLINIIPPHKVEYLNSIDIGIFLCFLETVLAENDIKYERTIITNASVNNHLLALASYKII